ncbi:choice-of-anchor V domain-containing protein [Lewinella sp. 4G2]|uniref:choice-of-anchor V domain-containing protein n=1 Tax=Lewinella sp. 4G2 TaxID=1803372 RepID=UPI0007B4F33F|nr:choice-of-anchor V domain-containing protein [Lewinella sp. 4G2]OAV46019.1 hypothetical protein A3850_017250 [Lewinella sp. 4G2]
MKRLLPILAVMAGLLLTILFSASSGGAAAGNGRGYTGAPSSGGGTESLCTQCHGGGNFGEPGVAVLISETDGGDNVAAYKPGETYFVTVDISALNSPAAYGFQSLFLADDGTMIRPPAGTLQNPTNGTRISAARGRDYAEQSARSATGSFSFEWVAPEAGTGEVTMYTVGNAVNSNFGTSGDSPSTAPTIVTLSEDRSLPVDLVSFTATAEKGTPTLRWEAENEEAFSHYSVERNTGLEWTTIARVDGNGAEHYSFSDVAAPVGENTYRLKMEDLDGTYAYSPVRSLLLEEGGISIYPNPTQDFIKVPQRATLSGQGRIISADGKVIRAVSTVEAIDVRDLAPGVYYLSVELAGNPSVQRFIKR